MAFDAHKNFAKTTVAAAPSPATTGTSLTVEAGTGALFPATPFNATVWPTAAEATATNAEIVRVTNRVVDVLTIERKVEETSARAIVVGDQIEAGITAKTATDIEAAAGSSGAVRERATNNIAIGEGAMPTPSEEVGGRNNIAIGKNALKEATEGTELCTAVGTFALRHNTERENTAIGCEASQENTTGKENVAVGGGALQNNKTGSYNVMVGNAAGEGQPKGGSEGLHLEESVGVGIFSLTQWEGEGTTALGAWTMALSKKGNYNVAVGWKALNHTEVGSQMAIGVEALYSLTTATGPNTAIGYHSMKALLTGEANTAVGWNTLPAFTGNGATAVGHEALSALTTGASMTALGNGALKVATTAEQSVAIGTGALATIVTGGEATAVGYHALNKSTGGKNTAVGYAALAANTTGTTNVAVGGSALTAATEAAQNVAVGTAALVTTTTGGENTAVGYHAGNANIVGTKNVYIGMEAGNATTGSGNVFVGYQAGKAEVAVSNKLIIGNSETGPLITGTMSATAANRELGFYGVTPTKRAAAITSPAETLAALKTAVDALRVAVQKVGITE